MTWRVYRIVFAGVLFLSFSAPLPGARSKLLKNKSKLSRINVNSRLGYISVFVGDRLTARHKINDPLYREAVKKGTLDTFFKLPELSLDRDGNYQVPIKIVNFPHVDQIEGTCFEATVREWSIYFAGDLAADAPCLWDVGLFNTAVKKGIFNVSYSNALVKVKVSRDGEVKYSGNIDKVGNRAKFDELQEWMEKYMEVQLEGCIFKAEKRDRRFNLAAEVSKNILLGNGFMALSHNHAMNAFGTYGEYIFISTWGREFLIKRPPKKAGGCFEKKFILFVPKRDKEGVVETPIAKLASPEHYNNNFVSGKRPGECSGKSACGKWLLPFGGEFSEWFGELSLSTKEGTPFAVALKNLDGAGKITFSGEIYMWGEGGFVFDYDKNRKSFFALMLGPKKQDFMLFENGKFSLIKTFKKEINLNDWESFSFEVNLKRIRVRIGKSFSVWLNVPQKMRNHCIAGIIADKSSRVRMRKFTD